MILMRLDRRDRLRRSLRPHRAAIEGDGGRTGTRAKRYGYFRSGLGDSTIGGGRTRR